MLVVHVVVMVALFHTFCCSGECYSSDLEGGIPCQDCSTASLCLCTGCARRSGYAVTGDALEVKEVPIYLV